MIRAALACHSGTRRVRPLAGRSDDRDLGGLVVAPEDRGRADRRRARGEGSRPSSAARSRCRIATSSRRSARTRSRSRRRPPSTKAASRVERARPTTRRSSSASTAHSTATYTNSADYGREVIFAGGQLYLRPRYQRWHGRAPETPDEPAQIRERASTARSPRRGICSRRGVELTDRGAGAGRRARGPQDRREARAVAAQAAGRAARPAQVAREAHDRSASPARSSSTPTRACRSSVKLAGTVGFSRDGRRFTMKVTLESDVSRDRHAVDDRRAAGRRGRRDARAPARGR